MNDDFGQYHNFIFILDHNNLMFLASNYSPEHIIQYPWISLCLITGAILIYIISHAFKQIFLSKNDSIMILLFTFEVAVEDE